MNYTEILIANPINMESIKKLFDEIESSTSKKLIINIGEHEFESLDVLKELKKRFYQNQQALNRFSKIAFLHSAKFENISQDINKYNYFSDREKLLDWLNN